MIRIQDALTLSGAKLRTKRVLTIIVVIIASLLFGVLFAAIFLSNGFIATLTNYTKTAFNDTYLVQTSPNIPSEIYGGGIPTEETYEAIRDFETNYIEAREREAQEDGTVFDESLLESPLSEFTIGNENAPEHERYVPNFESEVFQAYTESLQEEYAKTADTTRDDLKRITQSLNPQAFYIGKASPYYDTKNLKFLTNNEETPEEIGISNPPVYTSTLNDFLSHSVRESQYVFMNDTILQRFLMSENETRAQQADSHIPVVITSKEAYQLFGKTLELNEEPENPEEKPEWLWTLREKINGAAYHVCYRNDTDIQQVRSALFPEDDEAEPLVSYGAPSEPCEDVIIVGDARTSVQITQDDTLRKSLYETTGEPERQLLKFQIVGIIPTSPMPQQGGLTDFVQTLLATNYAAGAIIPSQAYNALPDDVRAEAILQEGDESQNTNNVLERADIGETIVAFSNPNDAEKFMNNSCDPAQPDCDKQFYASPFGTNYLLLDDLQDTVGRYSFMAFIIVCAIALTIISFVIIRVIGDSRKETAVFRAIGAKRIDISAIYTLYTLALALRITIFSTALGLTIVGVLSFLYNSYVGSILQTSFGIVENVPRTEFIGYSNIIVLLVAAIFLTTLLAALFPILSNARRNPIKDMRGE